MIYLGHFGALSSTPTNKTSDTPLSATSNAPSCTSLCRSLGAFLDAPLSVLSSAPLIKPSGRSSTTSSSVSFHKLFEHFSVVPKV